LLHFWYAYVNRSIGLESYVSSVKFFKAFYFEHL
jgi:hypothetical protein